MNVGGCNMGACHGTPSGKNGFKLSLRGFDPAADYLQLSRDQFGRRSDKHDPMASLFLLIFPLIMPFKALAANILIYGLYALGFNLLFGFLGLLSFGHAALFGTGAYFCGIAIVHFGLPWYVAIPIGILGGAGMAAAIGVLAIRTRGIYFAMVTIALAPVRLSAAVSSACRHSCGKSATINPARWAASSVSMNSMVLGSCTPITALNGRPASTKCAANAEIAWSAWAKVMRRGAWPVILALLTGSTNASASGWRAKIR